MAQHDLPTQIAAARRELALRQAVYPHHIERKKLSAEKAAQEIANMEAIIRTLEWLYANEAKIKAKAEQPTQFPSETSGRTYTQKFTGHIDYERGSWQSSYEIFDDTGALIGFRHVGQDKKKGETYDVLTPYGSQEFKSPKEFIAAYERGDWRGRDPEISQVPAAKASAA